ncbi:unnamed protein product [Heligmosomoides polygyrus]|uniref:Protein kinase domain-containing protein n=1 Tax=Heligmosomoides polygyrus TaxID=6339 RepID=A0A183GIH8_HELPZ|nr:unnamed protein product [Heligmosomoides polygyrus]
MSANPQVVIHLPTLKFGSPLDAAPFRDEMMLAERIASILQDFELRQLEIEKWRTIHSALMNPFSRARKDESLALALRHPFMKCDDAEDEEEEENLQAIVGTASRSRNGALPTPPPSPTVDSFNAKVSK